MTAVAEALDNALKSVDGITAERLEVPVWKLIETVTSTSSPSRGKGWPPGYFERNAGSFRDEPLERPAQLPFEKRET